MSVLASIEPSQLTVDAGGQATLVVRVRNRGSIVDRFDIAVVGPTSGWVTIDPPALRLFPDKEDEARITFKPPRAPDPAADTYPFGIAVRAASDANDSTVEEGRVTVNPFVELGTEVVPQTSRGSRTGVHDVTIKNRGNAVAEVSIAASDPDRLMTFEILPARAGLRPGAAATVRAKAKPKDTFLMGSPRRLPFSIQVSEPSAGAYQVGATMEQRALLPSWIKVAAGLVVAGIAAIAFLPSMLGLNGPAASSPPPVALASTPPPATNTPAPATLPPPTEGPTPTPTFGPPDAIVAAGDETPLTGAMGITLVCPAKDGCRELTKTRVKQILDHLLGKADGAILADFSTTTTGTLPVIAKWSGWQYPYAADDGTKGLAKSVAIDLAPFIAGGNAYAFIQDLDGTQHYFVVPAGNAKLLEDSLYVVPVQPTPAPDPGGGGTIFLGDFYRQTLLDGVLLRSLSFTATPPP